MGKVRKAMGYRVDFEFDKIAISYQEATTVREFVAGMGTQARVTNVLLNGAMTEGGDGGRTGRLRKTALR